MNQRFTPGFPELPMQDRDCYLRAIEQARALGAEKAALQAHFERVKSDTRLETQIGRLTRFDAYLDRLRESYCAASSLLGLSIEPAGDWPALDLTRVDAGEEVQSLVLLVSLKHDRIKAMPIVAALNELQCLVRVH
jgi:hypothetical protein